MNLVKRTLIAGLVMMVALGSIGLTGVLAQDKGTAWLGVSVGDMPEGVTVREVAPDSPADEAGLRPGDVIVQVDDTAIDSVETLVQTIQSYAPGDEVVLTVEWRGDAREVTVTLAERPAQTPQPLEPVTPPVVHPMRGMLYVLGLTAQVTDEGLVVESVEADSVLAEAGLQEGDVITAVNGESVTDLRAGALVRLFRAGEPVTLTVLRDGEELEIEFEVPEGTLEFGMMLPDSISAALMPPTQLGVAFLPVTPELAGERDLPVEEGALIEQVLDDSPAAQAGLVAGDIVTAVNGEPVNEEWTLRDRLAAYEEGDEVTLTVLRDGETLELTVTLGPRGPEMGMNFRFGPLGSGGMMGQGGMMPGFEGFMQTHPFMGQMFGHMQGGMMPGFEGFMQAHPFMGQMFGHMQGGMMGQSGRPFFFGPDMPGFEGFMEMHPFMQPGGSSVPDESPSTGDAPQGPVA